jgi:hypothetical protein
MGRIDAASVRVVAVADDRLRWALIGDLLALASLR